MNHDLETAVKIALAPITEQDHWELCRYCGAMRHRLGEHTCRTSPLEFVGMEHDEKRRAKSYTID